MPNQRSDPGRPAFDLGRLVLVAAWAAGALLVPQSSQAKCAPWGIRVWPAKDTTIPSEARIAVSGYGSDQGFVRKLAAHSPVLVDGDERVPVEVVATYQGQNFIRAVLVPVRILEAGRTYALEVERNGARRSLGQWLVSNPSEDSPLRWESAPRVVDSTYIRYGCGPAAHVHVAAPIAGGSGPVAVRATVRPLDVSGAGAAQYELAVVRGLVELGYGMCGGAFTLRPGARYGVTLEAIDQAGRTVPAPGGEFTIVGPSQ